MKSVIFGLIMILCSDTGGDATYTSCGLDGSPASAVYAGVASIETYPWMGMLYYPMEKKRFTTSVVLVTRQMVIAAASEIDKLPKTNFRAKARVVLGHRCGVGSEIKVRDYTYHPEYVRDSFSALAMIQLETDHVITELRPICQPPAHFIQPKFFAMTLNENCKNPKVRVHRMQYVNMSECKNFYRRSGLDQGSIWPRHAACARSVSGGKCVWHSGTLLAVKQDGRWRLVENRYVLRTPNPSSAEVCSGVIGRTRPIKSNLGFSVYGPGCGDPARFLDYGMYHRWVRLSSSTMGQPAITRIGENHLVLRRSLSNLQRYGPCDAEEKIIELYSDKVVILAGIGNFHAKYNVSLLASFEYTCVTFKARNFKKDDYERLDQTPQPPGLYKGGLKKTVPKLRLRRWCATSTGICHGFQHIEIQFYVDINFSQSAEFIVHAYGRQAKVISASSAMKYTNLDRGVRPVVPPYPVVLELLKAQNKKESTYKWFYLKDKAATVV